MRRPSKVEHTELVALLQMLTFLDCDLACGNLAHSDAHEAHEANGGDLPL